MRLLALANEGQRELLGNMLASARRAGVAPSLFRIALDGHDREAARFGSDAFHRMTGRKIRWIRAELARRPGDLLWVDNDVVFFRDVVPELLARSEDFVMQDDLNMPCTGFWRIRNRGRTRRFLAHVDGVLTSTGFGTNDQLAFRDVFGGVEHGCSLHLLDCGEYPNGRLYFDEGRTADAKIVHNNYLPTAAAKVERFVAHGLWRPDPGALDGLEIRSLPKLPGD